MLLVVHISITVKNFFIKVLKLYAFSRLDMTFTNLNIDLFFDLLFQICCTVLNPRKNAGNVIALNHFLNIIAAWLGLIKKNVDFVHSTKEIMKIAHNVLV